MHDEAVTRGRGCSTNGTGHGPRAMSSQSIAFAPGTTIAPRSVPCRSVAYRNGPSPESLCVQRMFGCARLTATPELSTRRGLWKVACRSNNAVANMRLQEDTSRMRDGNVRLQGRILYLTEDPGFVRAQLAGEDPAWTSLVKLRDDISTDEITPAYICYYYDETLGEFPYLGLKCRDEFPITRGAVKQGGFIAAVSGKRRGKGSSREQSPYAEMCAGIKLVV